MRTINHKYLMLECGTHKPYIDVAFILSISKGFYLHIAFIFFYIQIDIDKRNKEINMLRDERDALECEFIKIKREMEGCVGS